MTCYPPVAIGLLLPRSAEVAAKCDCRELALISIGKDIRQLVVASKAATFKRDLVVEDLFLTVGFIWVMAALALFYKL